MIPLEQGTSKTQCYRVQANIRHQVFLTLVEEVEKHPEQGRKSVTDPLATDGEVGQKNLSMVNWRTVLRINPMKLTPTKERNFKSIHPKTNKCHGPYKGKKSLMNSWIYPEEN